MPVCIGVEGYTYPGPYVGGVKQSANRKVVPIQPGIVSNCAAFQYTDKYGQKSFADLLSSNHITRRQWNNWNWQQDTDDNLNVFAGYWSCIAVK